MKKNINIILLFFSILSYSQDSTQYIIRSSEFHNLKTISKTQAEKISGLEIGNYINKDDIYERALSILTFLEKKGYVYASIDSVLFLINSSADSISVEIFFSNIKKGVVKKVVITGADTSRISNALDETDSIEIQNFEPKSYFRDIVLFYEKEGRPFASIHIDSIEIDSTNQFYEFIIYLTNSPGPELYIDNINITGNEFTKDNVIRREIRIKKGDLYNYQKINSIQSRLMRLGYFKQVYPPDVFVTNKNIGGLSIHVKEGNTSKFDGIVGYTPATEFEKGYFTGLVDIEMGNLFGTGRSLKIHWQKRDQNSQDLELYYREPWIAGYPLHIGTGFTQLIQDTTYIERKFLADLELPVNETFSIISSFSQNLIIPDSIGSYILGIPQSKSLNASIGVQYDSRDNLINPKKGIYYFTNIESGSKKNMGPENLINIYSLKKNISNRKIKIDFDSFMQIFKNQIFSLSMHGRRITSNETVISLPDQFRLGGTRSLRGYREDQFRGSNVAWSNLEYRYLFGPLSRAFVFFDSGYYSANNENGNFKFSYGFGVRLETGLGVMGIDYGLPIGEKTEGVLGGMIHVGLINTF